MIRATQAQIAHFSLTRTGLTAEAGANIIQTVKRLVALPAGDITTPVLTLWPRLPHFRPDDLLAELYRARRLIKRPAMRNEPGIVAVDDLTMLHAATQRQRRQAFNTEFINWAIELSEVEALGQAILEAIGAGPVTAAAIITRLPPGTVRELTQTSRGGRISILSNVALALRWLEANGRLAVSQPEPPPDWREEAPAYAPFSTWLPQADLTTELSEAEAQLCLVRAYLAAFGPATEADVSAWTGFGKSETQRAINALTPETTLVMVDGMPGAMLLLKEQADTLNAMHPPARPVVNLLPADDPFVKAHKASRARLVTDLRLQRQIFSSADRAAPTIVVDGKIVGVWDWQKMDGQDRITWQALTDFDPGLLPRLQAELERLANFIGPQTELEPFAT